MRTATLPIISKIPAPDLSNMHYVPTADERAQTIDFKNNDARRTGWLVGWDQAVEPFRRLAGIHDH